MQFYLVTYLSWCYKSNENGNIWPWPLTLRAKIDGSVRALCGPRTPFNIVSKRCHSLRIKDRKDDRLLTRPPRCRGLSISQPTKQPIIHSFIRSFVRSFVRSFIHSFTHSLTHSFTHSFIHSFIHSSSIVYLLAREMKSPIGILTDCGTRTIFNVYELHYFLNVLTLSLKRNSLRFRSQLWRNWCDTNQEVVRRVM